MKARVRLLQFLRVARARRGDWEGPAGSGILLVREDGARHLTVAIEECLFEGLIVEKVRGRKDSSQSPTVAITSQGRAWLARHAARFTPEPFARQHQARETVTLDEPAGPVSATVNRHESSLTKLAHLKDAAGRSWLGRDGLEAGERLARDFTLGGLRQRVTASWDAMPRSSRGGRAGGQADLGDAALDARTRLERAIASLGPDLAGVALDICCFSKGTSQVERERRWPPRSAKLMLRTALDLLARHYGLRTGEARGATRTRAWTAAG